jgi:hypothetical protein
MPCGIPGIFEGRCVRGVNKPGDLRNISRSAPGNPAELIPPSMAPELLQRHGEGV